MRLPYVFGGAALPGCKRDSQTGIEKSKPSTCGPELTRVCLFAVCGHHPTPITTNTTTTTTTTGIFRRRWSSCAFAGGLGVGMVAAALIVNHWGQSTKERSPAGLEKPRNTRFCVPPCFLSASSSTTQPCPALSKLYKMAGSHSFFLLPLYTTTDRQGRQGKEQAATAATRGGLLGWLLRGAARPR